MLQNFWQMYSHKIWAYFDCILKQSIMISPVMRACKEPKIWFIIFCISQTQRILYFICFFGGEHNYDVLGWLFHGIFIFLIEVRFFSWIKHSILFFVILGKKKLLYEWFRSCLQGMGEAHWLTLVIVMRLVNTLKNNFVSIWCNWFSEPLKEI